MFMFHRYDEKTLQLTFEQIVLKPADHLYISKTMSDIDGKTGFMGKFINTDVI